MKLFLSVLLGMAATAANAKPLLPTSTAIRTLTTRVARDIPEDAVIEAIIPTTTGQIGINPVDPSAIKGSIGVNTEYLTDLGSTTSWIGPNPSYIVTTATYLNSQSSDVVATMTEGVSVSLNKAGGIDILLSEAVRERLSNVIKNVKPCGSKRKRQVVVVTACEIPQITKGIKNDPVLRKYFNEDFTDQMREVLLKKKLTLPTGPKKPVPEPEPEPDSDGYFPSEDDPEIEEAIQLGSAEDAALLEGVAAAEVFPGTSVSVGSFIALLWGAISVTKDELSNVYQIPEESIHTLTKTRTATTSTKPHSCPTETPTCSSACKPTSSTVRASPKATGINELIAWGCSEGEAKDCDCIPEAKIFVDEHDISLDQIIMAALEEVEKEDDNVLTYKYTKPGEAVKKGTELRLLPVGDSITVGFRSDQYGGDGNGYRGELQKDLSADKVVFAGTESSGTMEDGYYAAWSGQTIQYISDHVGASLKQRPNIILLAIGTNDMNSNSAIAKQGNDPQEAAERLGKLIDKMIEACPDATILVSMIISTCGNSEYEAQNTRTEVFRNLIPDVARKRRDDKHHVLAVDFSEFGTKNLRNDCVHPSNNGYKIMGDWWYDFIHQIPKDWIKEPVGKNPNRSDGIDANGGLDKNIPDPDWGTIPIREKSQGEVQEVASWAKTTGNQRKCNSNPEWREAGKIALGHVGHNGDWQYHKNWIEADYKKWGGGNKVAAGLGKDSRYVRLHDMNGDGKADYVWIDPKSGEITCWINNLPDDWKPAGNNGGVIGSGVTASKYIYLADMNGDGMDDYLVVDPDNGSVTIWWNYGPDDNWVNGWKFVQGNQIASGVPHANLETLRFPDINGDGRADYVYIGEGGSLKHHLNTGSPGGLDVLFHAEGGIATGAVSDISKLVFADMNGDGRDDYLIWDADGGLTGFLNQRTNSEGVPLYINQGKEKTIADGIKKDPSSIILADMDGDGKDDYVYVGENGALFLWYNRGETDDSMVIDGIRFADVDGDGADDYIWLDPKTGAPTVYLNKGPNKDDSLGWFWAPLNSGKPIASGAAPAAQVKWADVNGDGLDDYLDVNPKTGLLKVYQNKGEASNEYGWLFQPLGETASGLGQGKNVRFADIDGDGMADYIYLKDNGGTEIYRSVANDTGDKWKPLPDADASGIGQRPEEIQFFDINGDGRADYVWTKPLDGSVHVWLNDYPNKPTWRDIGSIAEGVGTSGNNIRYATLQKGSRPDYVVVDPNTGALGAWLNGCSDLAPPLLLESVPPVCNKESDYPGHAKIREDSLSLANDFCNKEFGNIDKRVQSGYKIEKTLKDRYGIKFRFSVTWIDGCEVKGTGRADQDVLNPEEDYSVRCWQTFRTPWKYCQSENNGVGAYQDIKCLRYELDAGV